MVNYAASADSAGEIEGHRRGRYRQLARRQGEKAALFQQNSPHGLLEWPYGTCWRRTSQCVGLHELSELLAMMKFGLLKLPHRALAYLGLGGHQLCGDGEQAAARRRIIVGLSTGTTRTTARRPAMGHVGRPPLKFRPLDISFQLLFSLSPTRPLDSAAHSSARARPDILLGRSAAPWMVAAISRRGEGDIRFH